MSDKIPGFSWTCNYSGEEVKIGDVVELVTPVYEGPLTAGKHYRVEDRGVMGRDAWESVKLINDKGEHEFYILEHFRKVLKPENTG